MVSQEKWKRKLVEIHFGEIVNSQSKSKELEHTPTPSLQCLPAPTLPLPRPHPIPRIPFVLLATDCAAINLVMKLVQR